MTDTVMSGRMVTLGLAAKLGLLTTPDSLPPVAILPELSVALQAPSLSPAQSQLRAAAESALAGLPAFVGATALNRSLGDAWWAFAALAAALPAADIDAASVPTTAPTQAYFRTRLAAVEPVVAFTHAVAIIARCLEDLRDAPVAASDAAKEVAAMAGVMSSLAAGRTDALPRQASGAEYAELVNDVPIDHRWRCRWLIAHQLHGLLSAHAAALVALATRRIEAGELEAAVSPLEVTTTLVEGLGATRAHAAAFSPDFYNEVLRPTMRPPANQVALSGAMHPESRAYQRQLRRLLAAAPEGYGDMALRSPALAAARERLLNADLADAERHVSLVEATIGMAPSIAQPADGSDSAVSALRTMRHRRAQEYAPFVRFAEQF